MTNEEAMQVPAGFFSYINEHGSKMTVVSGHLGKLSTVACCVEMKDDYHGRLEVTIYPEHHL